MFFTHRHAAVGWHQHTPERGRVRRITIVSLAATLVAGSALAASADGDSKIHHADAAAGTPCVTAPASCGFPDAASTGVPAGTVLTPSGTLKVSTPGSTVSGLDITGSLRITASNVTVRDVRVSCPVGCVANFLLQVKSGLSGIVIEDSEFAGSLAVHTGIGGGGSFTASRVDVHDVNDGVHLASGAVLADSFVHDLAPTPVVHADTVQLPGTASSHITIRHNTLLPFNLTTLVYDNSAIICGSQCTSTTDLEVENNLMDGGSQTLKCPDVGIADNVYRNNVFGLDYRFSAVTGACGGPDNTFAGNTFDGSGAPVVPRG